MALKLLVLGATGKTGSEVVKQALEDGHGVTAFVRDRTQMSTSDPRLRIVTGDATVVADLSASLEGQDAVISTLGSNKVSEKLIEKSTEALIEAMNESGVKRVVVLSTFAASSSYRPGLLLRLIGLTMRGMVADKQAGEAQLRQSGLDWTIVYATRLTDGDRTGHYRTIHDGKVGMTDSSARADVAACLVSQATNAASVHMSLMITGNGKKKP